MSIQHHNHIVLLRFTPFEFPFTTALAACPSVDAVHSLRTGDEGLVHGYTEVIPIHIRTYALEMWLPVLYALDGRPGWAVEIRLREG